MVVPNSGAQLLIILLFIIPGSVFQAVRVRLRGPTPADRDVSGRIVRALAVSALLNALYLAVLGGDAVNSVNHVTGSSDSEFTRGDGWLAVTLLFVVPAALAVGDYLSIGLRDRVLSRVSVLYDPTPRAWDFAFSRDEPCFIRILTGEGRWVGGWFSGGSFAASYPEPLEVYIERAWILDEHGGFKSEQAPSAGIYVRCDDAQVVEFIADSPTS